MKKRVLGIMVAVLGFVGFGLYGESLNRYSIDATVCAVDGVEIYFEDCKGDIWTYEKDGSEDYKLGDKVILKMHTNYTDNIITDDVIRKVKRA